MITFYLIRHGDKVRNIGDVGLTDLGEEQSRLIGKLLKHRKIDCLVTSPLRRSRETAAIISTILGLSYSEDQRLKERISYGDIKNQSYAEYVKLCALSVQDRSYVLPNGESSISAGKRVEEVLQNFIHAPFKNVVLISHGGVIGDYLRNVFPEKHLQKLSPSFIKKLEVDSSSITKIRYKNHNFFLEELNSTQHLDN